MALLQNGRSRRVAVRVRRILCAPLAHFRGAGQLILNQPRQLILPFRRDESVVAGHFEIAVAGNFGCLNSAPTDLLSPRDIRAAERVRAQTGEVAVRGFIAKFTGDAIRLQLGSSPLSD